ncbi:glycoside hydrolase family 73 protein [uncultured Lactobacillus sp.]|uniref:glycoside hydrolase family 73 protein n=1 Tax=uncultured Lactobacillus sp. TaxID=153152 RepID=UPI00260BC8AB|nr:glucosaminidase domain-containing protein [uncultured Lactobacillus sp.]
MNKRTITGIATAAALTATGISVTNNLKKVNNPSEGVVQAATVQSNQQFLNKAIPAATAASSKYGTYTSVMIAQAAVESGYGNSGLAQSPNNNLFGIKGSYNGQSVNMSTGEYTSNGQYYQTNANFRKYPSYQQSFEDNGALLRNQMGTFYKGTWVENSSNYAQATQNGLQGKYATAPNYAASLNNVIKTYGLDRYDPTTQVVNETRTIAQTTAITSAPVDVSVGTRVGTAQQGQSVNVGKYITYNNGVKYAYLTNSNGWVNAVAFGTSQPVKQVVQNTQPTQKPATTNTLVLKSTAKPVSTNAIKTQATAVKPAAKPVIKVTAAQAKQKVVVKTAAVKPAVKQEVKKVETKQVVAQAPTVKKAETVTSAPVKATQAVAKQEVKTAVVKQTVQAPKANKVSSTKAIENNTQVTQKAPRIVRGFSYSHNRFFEPAYRSVQKVVRVNYAPSYAVAVWRQPGQQATGEFLPNASTWKVTGEAYYGGHLWYQIGINQWIDSRYVSENTGVAGDFQQVVANNTTVQSTKRQKGTLTIKWRDDQGVTVWNAPNGKATGKYLQNGTSWRFFKSTVVNGEVWYNIGGNQWIPAKYVYVR